MRGIVAPGSMVPAGPASGISRETYFSPKSVLGMIEPVTLAGMVSSLSG